MSPVNEWHALAPVGEPWESCMAPRIRCESPVAEVYVVGDKLSTSRCRGHRLESQFRWERPSGWKPVPGDSKTAVHGPDEHVAWLVLNS